MGCDVLAPGRTIQFQPNSCRGSVDDAKRGGASTCRDFAEIFDAFRPFLKETAHDAVAQRATANYLQYEEWIEGYLFGMGTNIHSGGVLRDWDEVGMREWIYGFCQKHPSEIVANAALAFFEMLSGAPDAR